MKQKSIFLIIAVIVFSSLVSVGQIKTSEEFMQFVRMTQEQKEKQKDSLIKVYNLAITTAAAPEQSELYRKIGKLFLRSYSYEERKWRTDSSIFYYQKAIDVFPANADAYNDIGDTYRFLNNTNTALQYYIKASEVSPSNEDSYEGIMSMYKRLYKPDPVFYYGKKLLQVNPANGMALLEIALWFDTNKNPDSALYYYKFLVASKYSGDLAKERVGLLTMSIDKNDPLPLIYFTQMANEWPSGWRQYYNIACYYNNQGNTEKAMEYLEKALQKGMRNRNQLYTEPFLASAKNNDQFKKLVEKYLPG